MKKLLSILLLVIYLIPTTELFELAKLPVLMEHYKEHQAWNPDITFIGFIAHHYAQSIEGNPDEDMDRKLPFKSNQDVANFWVSNLVPIKLPHFQFKNKIVQFILRQDFVYRSPFRGSNLLTNIWQPPKY